MTKSPTYRSWKNMKARCYNPKDAYYSPATVGAALSFAKDGRTRSRTSWPIWASDRLA